MATIITINNQKGGVAKTTTSLAIAAGLTLKSYRVLCIDLDPQSNLSLSGGANSDAGTIYDVMKGDLAAIETVQSINGLNIIPSNILLSGADMEFTKTGREYLLKESLESLKDLFDYIIVDTPPSLGILTVNSLVASNLVIIPMTADMFALQGMGQLNNTIIQVRKYCNPSIRIAGILLTKYNNRTILSRDLMETIQETAKNLNTKVFKTTIREGIAIREAQTQQQSIFKYAPQSNPGLDYESLIQELLMEDK